MFYVLILGKIFYFKWGFSFFVAIGMIVTGQPDN